jgi:hypothetical protein
MKTWTPETTGYNKERLGFQRRAPHQPAKIFGATSAADIQEAVRYARDHDLKLAVKATGHGHTRPTDAVLITTSRFDDVTVDPGERTATIQAGASWQQVIDAAAKHRLAPLSGSFPGVGAISYTLGGGVGLMARRHGFAADHVRRIEVVTPDGTLRTAEGELFWALRGGGGNFGIVTELEVDLFPVTTLFGGSLYYDLSANPGILETWREWTATVPDEVTSAVAIVPFPDIPPVPAPLRGKYVAQVSLSILGSNGEELIQPLRALGTPLLDTVGEIPYTESGRIFAEPERPDAYGARNVLLNQLDPVALATIPKLAGPGAAAMCVVMIRHLGGALARPPKEPNAVGHRDAAYSLTVLTPGEGDAAELHRAVLDPWQPYVVGRSLNFSFAPLDQHQVSEAYEKTTHDRLLQLRNTYDPTSMLQPNHQL